MEKKHCTYICDGQSEVEERIRRGARDEGNTRKESVSGREGWGVRGGQVP